MATRDAVMPAPGADSAPAVPPPMAVGVSFDFSTAPQGWVMMRYQDGPFGLDRELRLPLTALGLAAAELGLRAVGITPNFAGTIIHGAPPAVR